MNVLHMAGIDYTVNYRMYSENYAKLRKNNCSINNKMKNG